MCSFNSDERGRLDSIVFSHSYTIMFHQSAVLALQWFTSECPFCCQPKSGRVVAKVHK